jgi:hypothetical protein
MYKLASILLSKPYYLLKTHCGRTLPLRGSVLLRDKPATKRDLIDYFSKQDVTFRIDNNGRLIVS